MRNEINPYHYCKKIISLYLKHFLKGRKEVLDSSDIEFVHRMRVASRRLRAALSVFESILPTKMVKIWKGEIGKIGRVLGIARQLDVQIKFLDATKKRLKNNSYIFPTETIIVSLKKKRGLAQEQINVLLDGFEIKKRLPGLTDCFVELSSGVNTCTVDTRSLAKGAIILKRLDTLFEFAPYVLKPQSIKELHRMRIAAKKLRYTLEIFRPYYGAKFDKYIRASQNIQDLLGDLHEFDVLAGSLSDFLSTQDKDSSDAVTFLTRECLGLRRGVYTKFVRFWRDLEKAQLWARLRKEI